MSRKPLLSKCLRSMALLSATTLWGTGCISLNSYTSARVLEPGVMETSVRTGFTKADFALGDLQVDLPILPITDVGFRYGVNGKADVGFGFGMSKGLTCEGRFQLFADKKVAVALNPSVGGMFAGGFIASAGYGVMDIPLVIGLMVGRDSELVFTPKVTVRGVFGEYDSQSGYASAVIPSLGIGMKLGLGPALHLYPELSIGSARGTAGSNSGNASESLGPVINVGMGFGFGGKFQK